MRDGDEELPVKSSAWSKNCRLSRYATVVVLTSRQRKLFLSGCNSAVEHTKGKRGNVKKEIALPLCHLPNNQPSSGARHVTFHSSTGSCIHAAAVRRSAVLRRCRVGVQMHARARCGPYPRRTNDRGPAFGCIDSLQRWSTDRGIVSIRTASTSHVPATAWQQPRSELRLYCVALMLEYRQKHRLDAGRICVACPPATNTTPFTSLGEGGCVHRR